MCRNLIFIALVLVILFTGCSKRTSVHQASDNRTYTLSTEINSSHFDRLILRIETDGHLRTHKASLVSSSTEFIAVTIFSNLRKPIATIVFDTLGLKILDTHQNSGFNLSYDYLEHSIGIPTNFNLVQQLIFGAPDISPIDTLNFESNILNSEEFTHNLQSHYEFHSIGRLRFFELVNSLTGDKLSASYHYAKSFKFPFPEVANIQLVYNGQPMEFELEFYEKHFILNQPVSFSYDSLILLKHLIIDNE